jgi:hypothetical protein
MKNSILILSMAITLLCVFLVVQKNRQMEAAMARATAAENKREAIAAQAAQQQKRSRNLRAELRESRVESFENASAAEELKRQLAAKQGTNDQATGVSAIFHDQAMREVLKDEARSGVARNVNALFKSGLARQLQLNDTQSEALKQLLTQKGSLMWEQFLVPMMTGEIDETSMAAAGKNIRQALDDNAQQMRMLLGNDGYDTYQWFDKTEPERDRLDNFAKQTAGAEQPLSDDQKAQLLGIMTDERAKFQFQVDIGDPSRLDYEHWYDNFTPEKIDAYSSEMEQLNDLIMQRAQSVLTPEQAASFKDFMEKQVQQSRLTARMTTAMMGR